MKHSFLKRFFRVACASFLVMAVFFTSQVPSASWSRFAQLTEHWLQGSWQVLNEKPVINVVSAADIQKELEQYYNWPSSRKHKGFDGGWILPFEMFDQRYFRGQVNPYRQPQYEDVPVSIDINGDGLLDLVYSKANRFYNPSQQRYYWNELQQYIILRRADGFELAYKCRQIGAYNKFTYYGDCADTNYTAGSQLAYETEWTPAYIMFQFAKDWQNKHPIRTDQEKANHYGKAQNVFDFIYQDTWINGSQRYTTDRGKPQFKDLNGDGLQDVIFFGYSDAGQTSSSMNPDTGLNFVLYNNGHGFDMVAGCIQRPNWHYTHPLASFLPAPPNKGHYCY